MRKKILLMLLLATLCFCQIFAASAEQQFAFFKRTVSPVMKWGENGILTVPKATTVGRTNSYFGLFGQQAGTINNLDLYSTSFSVIVGTSEDVELGYTRRQLIWEDFYLTDMSMDTFHIKARVLDFNSPLLPEVSIGMNGV
ncbi:MAG TPA: hypothetical protein DCG34_07850, partial [Clostridiales bacterium]|nr:hypothetical protein [Clostridiales bacterium]